MDRDQIVDDILEIAERNEPDELLETTAASVHPDLYEDAGEAFGGWDAALAAALCEAAGGDSTAGSRDDPAESISRNRGPDADHPLFGITGDNLLFKIDPGTSLPLTDAAERFDLPPGTDVLRHLHHVGDPEGLVFFTNLGNYFALSPRMVPKWKETDEVRQIARSLALEENERLRHVVPRRALYGGRIVHVTEGAKGKATEADDYSYAMDHEPRVAFKLDGDDRPVAVFAAPGDTGIFAASAHGRGIHFPDDELRSMGCRAVGVNVMDLEDDSDAVVDAFSAHRVQQLAVVTENGRGKRVDFDEFRQQGRAGAGMQLARLDRDDYVAGVVPCHPSDDIAIATDEGLVHRRPVADLPSMGRSAKGDRVVDLAEGASIVEFTSLPCSGA